MFGRGHDAAACAGCRRIQPLKWNYCRLCWCRARLLAKSIAGRPADETGVRDRLAAVRHHQLFFVGMHYRRRPTPSARRRGGRRGAPREPPPAPAWRPDLGSRQLPPRCGPWTCGSATSSRSWRRWGSSRTTANPPSNAGSPRDWRDSHPASARKPNDGPASCATAVPTASRDGKAPSGSTSTESARPCWNGRTATTTCAK